MSNRADAPVETAVNLVLDATDERGLHLYHARLYAEVEIVVRVTRFKRRAKTFVL